MIRLLTKQLKQSAVYWATPVQDGYGNATYDDPVEITVRWEDHQELFIDPAGEEKLSKAIVYVSQDMVVGERLKLCELADLDSSGADPIDDESAWKIKQFVKIPTFRATQFLRKCFL